MPPSITYTSSVVARSGSSPTSFMRRAVIHEPTRNAVAIISPNVLIGKVADPEQDRVHGRARLRETPASASNQLARN